MLYDAGVHRIRNVTYISKRMILCQTVCLHSVPTTDNSLCHTVYITVIVIPLLAKGIINNTVV